MSETLPLLPGSGPKHPPPLVGTPQPGRPGAKGANTAFDVIVAARVRGGKQAAVSGGSEVPPISGEDGKDLPQSLPGSQSPELLAEQIVPLGGGHPSGTEGQSTMPDFGTASPKAVLPTTVVPQSVEVNLLARFFSGQPVEESLSATSQIIRSTVDARYGLRPVTKPASAISQAIGPTTEPRFGQQSVEKPLPALLPVITPGTEPTFGGRLPGQPLPAAVDARITVPDSVLPGLAETRGEFTAPKTGLVEILVAASQATPGNTAEGRWPTSLAGLAGSTVPATNPAAGPGIAGAVPVVALEGRSGVSPGNSPVRTPVNQAGWDQAVGQRVLLFSGQPVEESLPALLPVMEPGTEPKFGGRLPGQPLPVAVDARTTVPDSVLPGLAETRGEFTAPKTGLVEILAAASQATPGNTAEGRWPTSLAGLAGSTVPATNPAAGPGIAGAVPIVALEGQSGVSPGNSTVHTPVNQAGWDQAVGRRVLWLVNQNVQSAQIQLNPPQLGPLEVHISVNKDQASLLFTSQQSIVREALEAALPRLREVFSDQGLNLASVDISQHSFAQRREPAPAGTGGAGQSYTDPEDADELPADEWSAGSAPKRGLVDYYV